SLRMMLWPTVPTTIVTSFMISSWLLLVPAVPIVPPLRSVQTPSFILPRDAGEERGEGLNGLNGWNDWNHYSYVDPIHVLGPCSCRGPLWENRIQSRQIFLREFNIDGLEIFLQVPLALVAWYRNDVITL